MRKPAAKKKAPARKKAPPVLENKMLAQIQGAGLDEPVRELVFDEPVEGKKKRRWRADFAWPDWKVILEVEGGVWGGKKCYRCKQRTNGRHNSPVGFEKDCEKYGHAVAQGWQVLRVTSKMIKNGLGIELLQALFARLELRHSLQPEGAAA